MIGKKKGKRLAKARPLDQKATWFRWSPKIKAEVRMVAHQRDLADWAEARPEVVSFEFGGMEIPLPGHHPKSIAVDMRVVYGNGVQGAVVYLGQAKQEDPLRTAICAQSEKLHLDVVILDQDHFQKNAPYYRTWRQMVRYLHRREDPSRMPAIDQILALFDGKQKYRLDAVAMKLKLDPYTTAICVAYLVHGGQLAMDTSDGVYDAATQIWRPQ